MFTLSIRNRLIAGFSILVVLILIGLGYSIFLASNSSDRTTELVDTNFKSLMAAESARATFFSASSAAKDFLQLRDPRFAAAVDTRLKQSLNYLDVVKLSGDVNTERVDGIEDEIRAHRELFNRMVALYEQRGLDENSGLQGAFRSAVHDIEESVKAQELDALTVLMLMVRRHEKDYMLRGDKKYIGRINQRVAEFRQEIDELGMSEDMKSGLMQQWSRYQQGIAALVSINDELLALREDFDATSVVLSREITALEEDLVREIDVKKDGLLQSLSAATATMTAILIAALGASTAVTYWIISSIARPLAAVSRQVESIVEGDLNETVSVRPTDEIGLVMQDVESMRLRLVDVISQIKSGTAEVANAVNQVHSGNNDLSARTQEQAAALEQIASSMEQMTMTVRSNAEHADRANELAKTAKRRAEHGEDIVERTIAAMAEIHSASSKIEEIIHVIDDIAFKINLLALNAAVEAARAGDQGRGFAVVANEVRELAGKSANSARQIKELILTSGDKVDAGRKLVTDSAESLAEILQSVVQVSDTVAEIAAASRQQSDGINYVNQSITHIDNMTQNNASLVEEVTATAESMGNQAKYLESLVSFFKVEYDAQYEEIEDHSENVVWLEDKSHVISPARVG